MTSSLSTTDAKAAWDPFAGQADPLDSRRTGRWIIAFLILGVAARLVRYALCFPLWPDEAYLAATHLTHGYLNMVFQPLEYHQVCPLLFLWAQHACVDLFGFNEFALRLFPLLCSLASLAIFWHLARRLLHGTALVAAVGIFAVSYPNIRYAAEAKPYGCDVLVSLVLVTLAVEWWRQPQRIRWLWALVAAAPLAVGLSYPAVFVGGGISLAVAGILWQTRLHRGWPVWIAWNLALGGSFLLAYQTCIKAQSAELGSMRAFWAERDSFPPLHSAGKFAVWLVTTHTGDMLSHPIGGAHGASTATFLCCAAAVVLLCRRRQYAPLALGGGTLALNFTAAALHRFPYGGPVRVGLYLAPLVCLLAGLGLAQILAWNFAWRRHRQAQGGKRGQSPFVRSTLRAVPANGDCPLFPGRTLGLSSRGLLRVLLWGLAAISVGSMVRDFYRPGHTPADIEARCFARWFWPAMEQDAEVVCMKTDEDWTSIFAPEVSQWGYSSLYLCNQRIYSPSHARGRRLDLERVKEGASEARPLRYVYYHQVGEKDGAMLEAWRRQMLDIYRQVNFRSLPIRNMLDKKLVVVATIEVYDFVRK